MQVWYLATCGSSIPGKEGKNIPEGCPEYRHYEFVMNRLRRSPKVEEFYAKCPRACSPRHITYQRGPLQPWRAFPFPFVFAFLTFWAQSGVGSPGSTPSWIVEGCFPGDLVHGRTVILVGSFPFQMYVCMGNVSHISTQYRCHSSLCPICGFSRVVDQGSISDVICKRRGACCDDC